MREFIIVLLLICATACSSANATTTVRYSSTGQPISATNGYGLRTSINNYKYNSPYSRHPMRYSRPYYNRRPPMYNYYHRPRYGYGYPHSYNPYYRYNRYTRYNPYVPYMPYNPYYYRPGVMERTLYRKALATYGANMLSSYQRKVEPMSRLHKDFRVAPPLKSAHCDGITYYGGTHACR